MRGFLGARISPPPIREGGRRGAPWGVGGAATQRHFLNFPPPDLYAFPPPTTQGPLPLSNLPPPLRPLLMQTPDESRGYARGGVGGEENGTPPPSASMWLAHGCIHLYQRWTLSPPISFPPPPRSGGDARGGGGLGGARSHPAASQLMEQSSHPAASQLMEQSSHPAASQLMAMGVPKNPLIYDERGAEPMEAPWGLQGGLGGGFASL
nr:hypothetical protein [Morchella crassipes]